MTLLSRLVIKLPLAQAGADAAYEVCQLTPEGQAMAPPYLNGSAARLAEAWPRDALATLMLPVAAVSWHRVRLPSGLKPDSRRMEAVLRGLLEDALLDDVGAIHLALQDGWRELEQPWVAACKRQWLLEHLAALEAVGVGLERVVPELWPTETPQAFVFGDDEQAQLWLCDAAQGVWYWPLKQMDACESPLALWPSAVRPAALVVHALPSTLAGLEAAAGCTLRACPERAHWLRAAREGWSLAQFELGRHVAARGTRRWARHGAWLLRGPAWRAARWGLLALALTWLAGLNAVAWKLRADWELQQTQWAQMVRETFPQVPLVVDAPLQMARELARLRQSAGEMANDDMVVMLSALGTCMPPAMSPATGYEYANRVLRVQGLPAAADISALSRCLAERGYAWRAGDVDWSMTLKGGQ